MVKISIITPTFNRVEALKCNFESVSSQNFKYKEHVIVDNLSSDGTEELIKKYKSEVTMKTKEYKYVLSNNHSEEVLLVGK